MARTAHITKLYEAQGQLSFLLAADTDAADKKFLFLFDYYTDPKVKLEFLFSLANNAVNDFAWRILQHPELDLDRVFINDAAGAYRNRAGVLLAVRKNHLFWRHPPTTADNLVFWTYEHDVATLDRDLSQWHHDHDWEDLDEDSATAHQLEVLTRLRANSDTFVLDYLAGITPFPTDLALEFLETYPGLLGDDAKTAQAVLKRILSGRSMEEIFDFYYRHHRSFQKLFPVEVQRRLHQISKAMIADAAGKDFASYVMAFL